LRNLAPRVILFEDMTGATAKMVDAKRLEPVGVESGLNDGSTAMLHIGMLNRFKDVVTEVGGDPHALLTRAQIEPSTLDNRHAVLSQRTFVRLLERAALELSCPDFGMRLAAAQGGVRAIGALGYVMRNSRTVRDAFSYCIAYVQAYSSAADMYFEPGADEGTTFMRMETFLSKQLRHPQTHERALLLTQLITVQIGNAQSKAREVWFTHDPISPLSKYREHFGCTVRFGQRVNGVLFDDTTLDTAVPKADAQVYELATNYIKYRHPANDTVFGPRIRTIVERLLLEGNCTHGGVAGMLGIHPRALQRRLRSEGESFEAIKDSVRREIALRYLRKSSLPLIRVARMLGYSETSALSRSCYRWFSASPKQLRGTLR
jgi:AraC-like DNA-binding protein